MALSLFFNQRLIGIEDQAVGTEIDNDEELGAPNYATAVANIPTVDKGIESGGCPLGSFRTIVATEQYFEEDEFGNRIHKENRNYWGCVQGFGGRPGGQGGPYEAPRSGGGPELPNTGWRSGGGGIGKSGSGSTPPVPYTPTTPRPLGPNQARIISPTNPALFLEGPPQDPKAPDVDPVEEMKKRMKWLDCPQQPDPGNQYERTYGPMSGSSTQRRCCTDEQRTAMAQGIVELLELIRTHSNFEVRALASCIEDALDRAVWDCTGAMGNSNLGTMRDYYNQLAVTSGSYPSKDGGENEASKKRKQLFRQEVSVFEDRINTLSGTGMAYEMGRVLLGACPTREGRGDGRSKPGPYIALALIFETEGPWSIPFEVWCCWMKDVLVSNDFDTLVRQEFGRVLRDAGPFRVDLVTGEVFGIDQYGNTKTKRIATLKLPDPSSYVPGCCPS